MSQQGFFFTSCLCSLSLLIPLAWFMDFDDSFSSLLREHKFHTKDVMLTHIHSIEVKLCFIALNIEKADDNEQSELVNGSEMCNHWAEKK